MNRELTREEFVQEITELNKEGKEFEAQSVGSGSIYITFTGTILIDMENGTCGEITFFKPYGNMEVTVDFDIIDTIIKRDAGSYLLEMDRGLSDIEICVVE